jgi:EmrB/QacA subfamily drug resistance transporter
MQSVEPKARIRILFACMTTLFLAALDQTIIAPALPAIANEFSNWHDISWTVSAYLLVATAVIPIYGRASDIYGRRPVLVTAIVVFCAGSILCAMSVSVPMLAISRGVQALGGGGLISMAMTIVGDIFAPRERGRYQGYISGIYASAAVIGPALGGFISEALHWSVIFWINIPIGGAALLVAWFSMADLRHETKNRNLDLPGAALFAGGTALLILAISSGGVRWAWTSIQIAVLLVSAAGLLWLFVRRVLTIEDALIARRIVADGVIHKSVTAALLVVGTAIGLSTYVPAYFQINYSLSATEAGLAVIPMMFSIAVGATLSGRSMSWFENYKLFPLGGLALATVIMLSAAIMLDFLTPVMLSALLAVSSFGMGTFYPVSIILVQNAAGRNDMGAATALMNFSRQLGGVLLVAVFSAVLFGSALRNSAMEQAATVDGMVLVPGFSAILLIAAFNLAAALLLLHRIEQRPLRTQA